MVIASQPLSAQAGLKVLGKGGNAVDAAIAAAAVLAVVEPTNNGIGGDSFALVWDGKQLRGINASGRAPERINTPEFLRKYGTQMPTHGWDSVTVPGVVSCWAKLSENFGKLPFSELLIAAINYARDGFHVTTMISKKWSEEAVRLSMESSFLESFSDGGNTPSPGQLFQQPDLARTLQRISETNGADFYVGETAEMIGRYSEKCNAALSVDDLRKHKAIWVGQDQIPMVHFGNSDVYEMPPNGQGLIVLYALALLDALSITDYDVDSPESIHLQIECIKKAFADLAHIIADPGLMSKNYNQLLCREVIVNAAKHIKTDRAGDYKHKMLPLEGTVYLAAGDKDGMMVSLIQSNYMGFGSGIVVPGTGVALQNRAAGFSLDGSSLSQLQGGKRPFHTILPGFFNDKAGDMAVFGATGGNFQPQGHIQIITKLRIANQNPQEIINSPRFKVSEGRQVTVEVGFNRKVIDKLIKMGHKVTVSTQKTSGWGFGGMQIMLRRDGKYIGGKDFRRDSHIAVA